ncbi:hypothetical protein, partial [Escherichia coli]|uniref:hypothetical protein n=1 Tax=Escherichia coli TaxID=562 RepID=UPI0013874E41
SYAEIDTYVFRPNLVIVNIDENTEEDPGAYIQVGKSKSCEIVVEGELPSDLTSKITLTLSCSKQDKITLLENNTPRPFPFEFSASSIPSLSIKGKEPSDNYKDITLSLTTSVG